jgi:N-dimethylarginine dimethylaminohydrolase
MMRAWMVDPAAYEVAYAINPHMAGNVGRVDRPLARRQWDEIGRIYRRLGLEVEVVPAVVGLPDLVFAANSCAAIAPGLAALSRMASAERAPEVPHVAAWLAARGWRTLPPPPEPLEGMGDLRPIPGTSGFLGGHGFRTTPGALAWLAAATGREIVPLRLVDPRLYHLDTALMPVGGGRVAWVPSAFDAESRVRVAALFPVRVEVPLAEAVEALGANGLVFGNAVVLEARAVETAARLRGLGLEVVGCDTSEFLKSGGSVFCLTQLAPG